MKNNRLITLILFSIYFLGCGGPRLDPTHNYVCLRNHCIDVELAKTENEHAKGLQGRSTLGKDHGMLFIFTKPGAYTFWMKDTLIDLDIVWLDYARRVVYISPNTPSCKEEPCPTYTPDGRAVYVLEINSGYASQLGMKLGDTLEFRLRQ